MSIFDTEVGPCERAAMERRRWELRLIPLKSIWEGRELDELNRKLGKPKDALGHEEGL